MSNSPLVNYTRLSPNYTKGRNCIDTITIHCVVGQCTVETLGAIFANSSYRASSNYGIGKDGRVGMYVEECDRSWCSSSSANDRRAITIECASDSYSPYAVNDTVYNKCIQLVADICARNGIKALKWSTNKSDRVNHANGCNMTVHRDYANKSCPGDYLYSRMGDIAAKVNAILGDEDYRPTLQNGDAGDYVKEMQTILIEKGYDLGEYGADGDFGDATEDAVIEFQTDNGLEADGIVGEATWAALLGTEEETEEEIEDEEDEEQETVETSYIVQIVEDTPIVKEPPYRILTNGRFTIEEESNGYGKLKSGAGWIPLDKVKRLN